MPLSNIIKVTATFILTRNASVCTTHSFSTPGTKLYFICQVPGDEAKSLLPVYIVSNTYSIMITDTDISFFLNKRFHSVLVAIFSCNVQGSSLIEKKHVKGKTVVNQEIDGLLHRLVQQNVQ